MTNDLNNSPFFIRTSTLSTLSDRTGRVSSGYDQKLEQPLFNFIFLVSISLLFIGIPSDTLVTLGYSSLMITDC